MEHRDPLGIIQVIVWIVIAMTIYLGILELAQHSPEIPATDEELTTGARTPGT